MTSRTSWVFRILWLWRWFWPLIFPVGWDPYHFIYWLSSGVVSGKLLNCVLVPFPHLSQVQPDSVDGGKRWVHRGGPPAIQAEHWQGQGLLRPSGVPNQSLQETPRILLKGQLQSTRTEQVGKELGFGVHPILNKGLRSYTMSFTQRTTKAILRFNVRLDSYWK